METVGRQRAGCLRETAAVDGVMERWDDQQLDILLILTWIPENPKVQMFLACRDKG